MPTVEAAKNEDKSRHFTEAADLIRDIRADTVMSKYASMEECQAAREALSRAEAVLRTVARLTR
jgi:hypothetical protein